MNFPTKGLSKRKQQEWLDANNPYPPESIRGLMLQADFYTSQAKIFDAQADRAFKWAIGLLIFAGAAQVVALILRLAGL